MLHYQHFKAYLNLNRNVTVCKADITEHKKAMREVTESCLSQTDVNS